jgi:hypothetical protein
LLEPRTPRQIDGGLVINTGSLIYSHEDTLHSRQVRHKVFYVVFFSREERKGLLIFFDIRVTWRPYLTDAGGVAIFFISNMENARFFCH